MTRAEAEKRGFRSACCCCGGDAGCADTAGELHDEIAAKVREVAARYSLTPGASACREILEWLGAPLEVPT